MPAAAFQTNARAWSSCIVAARGPSFLCLVCLGVWRAQAQPATASEAVEPALFNLESLEDGFCSTTPSPHEASQSGRELSTSSMACAKMMEFAYISRLKLWERLSELQAEGPVPTWRLVLQVLSRASSYVSAHGHVIAAIASQRPECFSEHVRLLLVVNLRRMKGLANKQFRQLWTVAQEGPEKAQEGSLASQLREWLEEAVSILDGDLRTMRTVLRTWRQPAAQEARFYSHEADGRFSTMETLRRDTFEEWQMDKGLLRGLIRHAFRQDAVVGDFGAGSGHYSRWLNNTGLVTAYAFDGSPDVELVTKGAVLMSDLGKSMELWTKFDWVLCLEVAENIPPELAPVFLQNLERHVQEGLVISWARPGLRGLGTANPQAEPDVLRLLGMHTQLHVDEELTNRLRSASLNAVFRETLLVLVRGTRDSQANPSPSASVLEAGAAGCSAEDGWIYAGNDVQMFSSVPNAATCCELCNSNAQCEFWTWSREDSHKDLCWIKATREYRINHEGFISGSKRSTA